MLTKKDLKKITFIYQTYRAFYSNLPNFISCTEIEATYIVEKSENKWSDDIIKSIVEETPIKSRFEILDIKGTHDHEV